MKGHAIAMEDIQDAAFASGALGKGVGIEPTEGKVYAPCDGVISVVFNTKHAIGLESESGAEVLIHIGINTVNLGGKYFDVKVKQGDVVTRGQLIAEVDLEGIRGEGYSLETPLLITNADECGTIQTRTGEVDRDTTVIEYA